MPEDQLRDVIEGIRTRLQAELESQFGALRANHDEALARTRQEAAETAEQAAEQRWSPKVDAVRSEWAARLESEVAAARSEVERTMVAESMRIRVEAEQLAAESASNARRELEQAVAAERQRSESLLEAERGRAALAEERAAEARRELEQTLAAERQSAASELDTERQRAEALLDAERGRAAIAEERASEAATEIEQALAGQRQRAAANLAAAEQRAQAMVEAERDRAARDLTEARAAFDAQLAQGATAPDRAPGSAPGSSSSAPDVESLLEAIRAIDSAASLSEVLSATVRAAARHAPRAALFLVTGEELAEWPVRGVPAVHAGSMRVDGRDAGILGEAVRRSEAIWTGAGTNGSNPPAFAALAEGRTALASPFVLAGQPVAVLYADDGVNGGPPAAWSGTIQILARHAAAAVAYLTAVRTAQAMRFSSAAAQEHVTASAFPTEDHHGARRYARLLVSEIKLYNEAAVRMGRERRDLLQRLKPEIERARVLYEERISIAIGPRETYFHQELLQTLADGDQSLLGSL